VLDLDAVPAFLQGRRWFGGKGAPIAGVRAVDDLLLLPGFRVVTIEVSYRGGRPPERYLLPLLPGPRLEEALADDGALRALLGLIRDQRTLPTAAGTLRGERVGGEGSPLDALGEAPAVRRLSAEQSNTSIVFGESVILKLIRKLEPGVNPELEMGAFLARRGFRATPPLLGGLSLSGAVDATVAVAHRFVSVESDGWSYVLEAFRRSTPGIFAELRQLGARIGEMHAVLASDPGDPSFAPEPLRREDLERSARALLLELDRTIVAAAAAVPELASRRAALEARIQRVAKLTPSGVRIRQHGDLHLGQVLRSQGQWLVFDFEGEPARPVPERRAKSSPLKDVAGMLRSFAYAAATASTPQHLAPARQAFLEGWRGAAARLVPADAQALLESLELEKLLYELRYEVGHRPAWVRIPARDLLALAG
jgi:maltokinase